MRSEMTDSSSRLTRSSLRGGRMRWVESVKAQVRAVVRFLRRLHRETNALRAAVEFPSQREQRCDDLRNFDGTGYQCGNGLAAPDLREIFPLTLQCHRLVADAMGANTHGQGRASSAAV